MPSRVSPRATPASFVFSCSSWCAVTRRPTYLSASFQRPTMKPRRSKITAGTPLNCGLSCRRCVITSGSKPAFST